MLFQKTLIIGLGLIGGSFAKALQKSGISKEIFAYDLDDETIDLAANDKTIIRGVNDLEFLQEELPQFDFIVLATPISSYEEILEEITPQISPKAVIIDLGSIKDLKIKNLPKNFIPCHPIAGSENTGFEHSSDDLFLGKKFIICPENRDQNLVNKVVEVVKKIGATPEFLEAKKHDEIYALVSHLPQFLSFLTKEFSPKDVKDDFFKTAFRLDESSPEIWDDIFEMNEENLEKFYLKFFDELENFTKNLESILVKTSPDLPKFDEKFFEENFTAIFFRVLVVKSYLEISEIKNFHNYAGSGFRDFTSIISLLNYDSEILRNLIKKNQKKILKIFNSIS